MKRGVINERIANKRFQEILTKLVFYKRVDIRTLVLYNTHTNTCSKKKDSGWQCYTTHNVLKYMHNVLTNRTTSTNINIYWKFFQGTGVLFFTFFT